MDEPAFKEVTKEEFKEVYFRLGGGASSAVTFSTIPILDKSGRA